MHLFTAWCGFLGSWVLVTGPVYQGAVELGEVEVDKAAGWFIVAAGAALIGVQQAAE